MTAAISGTLRIDTPGTPAFAIPTRTAQKINQNAGVSDLIRIFLNFFLLLSTQALTFLAPSGNTRIFDKNMHVDPIVVGRPFSKHPKTRFEN